MTIASICPVCNGTGWIQTESDDPYDRYMPDVERCPQCRGNLPQKAPTPEEKEGTPEGEV